MSAPKISFGVIVLNGEPFTRFCLRSLYPFAHQLIVVEGAVPAAKGIATADGHSTDGTLDELRRFAREEDPEGKVTVVTAESCGHRDGFWPGEKDEMSEAYAARATGDWLWQVDIDEFYRPEDMATIFGWLAAADSPDVVSFKTLTFWGGFDYVADGWFLRRGAAYYDRLFRWRRGFRYSTHRPPTVVDEAGRDLRGRRWLTGKETAARGVLLYHYSLLLPKQVDEKCRYYSEAEWAKRTEARRWADEDFSGLRHPFRVHNVYEHPSWLERFHGQHPPQIGAMREALAAGSFPFGLRPTADVERLLHSPAYVAGRGMLKALDLADRARIRVGRMLRSAGSRR